MCNNVKHRKFITSGSTSIFSQMTSYTVPYDVIYHPLPVNSQYLKTCGLTALKEVETDNNNNNNNNNNYNNNNNSNPFI